MSQPTPSDILITLTEGDSRLFPGLEVESIQWTGESAEFEQEAGMLENAIAPMFKPSKPGSYFLYGFKAHYNKDYYGEVDADYELEGWREATIDDENKFENTGEWNAHDIQGRAAKPDQST